MRTKITLNKDWFFSIHNKPKVQVDIPHTWNAIDGQDGGNDYYRGIGTYEKLFKISPIHSETELVYLEFNGVNSSADVIINGKNVCHHDGGYSTFRADITNMLKDENELTVHVSNEINDKVYPQRADFTFYGGIYRDVNLIIVNKKHFEMDYFGGSGIKITPEVVQSGGSVIVETFGSINDCDIAVTIFDASGEVVVTDKAIKINNTTAQANLNITKVHLWDGVKDPYLYTAKAELIYNGEVVDVVESKFGIRTFRVDPKEGFFLNGKHYPLHGVSRHQDRKGIGNAISIEQHREDMDLIREIGANTIRLAHYQHDQYIYDLCDEYGFIVWAEIPYISDHMPDGRENTISQMKELIVQNYNHPSIVTWGVSNEITIGKRNRKDMMENHRILNNLCHEMDKTRPTSLACYATCPIINPVVHVTDIVSYNLYLGWYVPGLILNDLFMQLFHFLFPNRALGYSEYGAEGMPNLHSSKPRRGDHTEEYQMVYHEYMLKCFKRHPFLWSTHVWNMFDFAADARDQGGEPGMNHKGLITFDRKIKKDSFYLYKAYWSDDPFVHICGKRYKDRTGSETEIKVCSNQKKVTLYKNGELVGEQSGDGVFIFKIKMSDKNQLEAVAGECKDTSIIRKCEIENSDYKLKKGKSKNWV